MTERTAGPHRTAAVARARLAVAAAALLALARPVGAADAPPAARPLQITYVTAGAVYVDGGRVEGLAVGQRIEVRRSGEPIALLEVAYVADHSASCRVVSQRRSPTQGDVAVALLAAPTAPPAPPVTPEPAVPRPAETPPEALVPAAPAPAASLSPRVANRVSGYLSLGMQQFDDGIDAARGYDEGTARVTFRVRDLQGLPMELRVRGRTRQTSRTGTSGAADARSDRLYEASLAYAPREGRLSWAVGRLGASPFVSIGYLDGALAQLRMTRRWYAGAFAGSRPDERDLGLTSTGTKYGGFLRFSTGDGFGGDGDPLYAEVVLAGIGEYAKRGEVSREYVSLESRLGAGARWSLYQRAELDLNRGWRQQLSGSSSQVSNASLAASVRLSKSFRALVTYDQRRNYLTYESRPLPEEVFTRYLREGARATLEWQNDAGWLASLGGGLERDDQGGDPTTSASFSLGTSRFGSFVLSTGLDLSMYSGGVADGYVATFRVRRPFRGGHDLGLTLGTSSVTLASLPGARSNQWARLSGTVQLPWRLYVIGELEYDTGDDLAGTRYLVEVGYQF